MAQEGIFNDLNLNPLIIHEDNEDPKNDIDNDDQSSFEVDDHDDVEDPKNQDPKNKGRQPREEVTIEVDEDETDEDTPPHRRVELDDEDENNTNDGLKQWVNFYRERGLIAEDIKDEEVGDIETLFEKLQEQQLASANMLVDSYKESLPKEIKDLIETWEEGAEGEAFKRVMSLKAEQVEIAKLEPETIKGNVDLQKTVIKNYLKRTTKYDDAKIDKYIKRLEDLEELEDEAVSSSEELKNILETEQKEIREATKAREAARVKAAQEQRIELTNYIKEIKAIIPDINITDGEKREIENMIFNPVAKDANGNPVFYLQKLFNDNPKEMAVKINYLAVMTKGFTDWSKLFKKAETKVSRKVESLLDTPPPTRTSRTKSEEGKEDWKQNLRGLKR